MTHSTPARPPIRFRGRSFLAVVLAPEAPVEAWLSDLDALMQRSPAFFAGRAVILDVTALKPSAEALTVLVGDLTARGIPIMGLEGAGAAGFTSGLPPRLTGGRAGGEIPVPGEPEPAPAPIALPERPTTVGSLVLDAPVRSGQQVLFPEGDVTVMGSVASGAEVIAGGSIHVYGALRGRAIAGAAGNANARIVSSRFAPELLAIDGLYRVADDIEPSLLGRAVHVWLDGDAMRMKVLD
ncbi:septum site-determining protein MinC [Methylobacterium sp. 4-46]|uniref:septum site-determining protein MinC n=1 Tax=unclassified Methylobacterium TaxID=2615210 RepID=UPI000152DA6A|nr:MULTISPECIES: septum site-determining protein MinC [Methylobacterium]ACA18070.1 septum site-determining protein MinC [Methylobacterium sp. 4-46]WFT77370.1 septum site-determining protein MinC [Methylobacterium nodulans]